MPRPAAVVGAARPADPLLRRQAREVGREQVGALVAVPGLAGAAVGGLLGRLAPGAGHGVVSKVLDGPSSCGEGGGWLGDV